MAVAGIDSPGRSSSDQNGVRIRLPSAIPSNGAISAAWTDCRSPPVLRALKPSSRTRHSPPPSQIRTSTFPGMPALWVSL